MVKRDMKCNTVSMSDLDNIRFMVNVLGVCMDFSQYMLKLSTINTALAPKVYVTIMPMERFSQLPDWYVHAPW